MTVDVATEPWVRFSPMITVLASLLLTLRGCFLTRAALHIELLALRHQIHVERSRPRRLRLTRADRLLWVWLSSVWDKWQATLIIVKPETVIASSTADHGMLCTSTGLPHKM